MEEDWTVKNGRSNSSDQFELMVEDVERLIREEGYALINGQVRSVARLIIAQLAHKHKMRPESAVSDILKPFGRET